MKKVYSPLIEALLDDAFTVLQHDIGETNVEWHALRDWLASRFRKSLERNRKPIKSPHPPATEIESRLNIHIITGPNGQCMCGTDGKTCAEILSESATPLGWTKMNLSEAEPVPPLHGGLLR